MRDFQLDPNFRTNTNGGPHGRIVPLADIVENSLRKPLCLMIHHDSAFKVAFLLGKRGKGASQLGISTSARSVATLLGAQYLVAAGNV